MSLLCGKSEGEVRLTIAAMANRKGMSVDEFFAAAAKQHAPDLCQRIVQRKLRRYQSGCAAPVFVKDHVHHVLDEERRHSRG